MNGRTSGWFRGTQERLEGHIQCDAADDVNAAYTAKCRRYPKNWIDAVLTPEAKSATIKLQPRS